MIASVVMNSACRSRCRTCDETGAGAQPELRADGLLDLGRQVRERADRAGELAERDRRARALEPPRSRCSSSYQSAIFSPKVIGSACTPCVRPIIGVSL